MENKFVIKIILLCALTCSHFCCVAATQLPSTLDDVLTTLDNAIDNKSIYETSKQERLDSMKRLALTLPPQKLSSAYEKIGDDYQRCNIDSALHYYTLGINVALHIGDSAQAQHLELSKVALLPVRGMIKEAVELYDSIGKTVLPSNKFHKYEVGNRLFYFASSFYPQDESRGYYIKRAREATDTLLTMMEDKEGSEARLYKAQLYKEDGNPLMMVAEIRDVIYDVDIDDFVFARAVSHLAEYYEEQPGKEDEMLYNLGLASLSDIYSATLEGTALQKLGVALYDKGDVDRAYKYLSLSLDNAVKSGSRIRALQSAEVYPIISQTFRAQDERKLTWLTWLVVALVFALIIITGSLVFLRKEMRKLSELKVRLSHANITKDTYISQFLSLSSLYIEKLEEFHRMAKRKLKANQVADLYALLESESMLNEQSQMFYKIFDNAFIHIYPTFVSEVNALLMPDKRFELPPMRLNTELRILAFLRLGINDSEQIARFLGLSLNTIYTYRNKLKNRAFSRNDFEKRVMGIGAITA